MSKFPLKYLVRNGVVLIVCLVLCVTQAYAWPRGIDLDTLGSGEALREKNRMRRRILREVVFYQKVETLEESDFFVGEELFKKLGILFWFLKDSDWRKAFLEDFGRSKTEKYLEILKHGDIVAETRKELNEKGLHEHAKILLMDAQSNQKKRTILSLKNVDRDEMGNIIGEETLAFEPQTFFVISDYNTTQRMKRYGEDQVFVRHVNDAAMNASVSKELVRDGKRVGRRFLEITYDSAGGECVYGFTLKPAIKKQLKAVNAIGWKVKGGASFVDFIVKTKSDTHVYSYVTLSDEWRTVIIPFVAFSNGGAIQWDDVQSLEIVLDGDKQETLTGILSVDDFTAYMLSPEELTTTLGPAKSCEYRDSSAFIKNLFEKRTQY